MTKGDNDVVAVLEELVRSTRVIKSGSYGYPPDTVGRLTSPELISDRSAKQVVTRREESGLTATTKTITVDPNTRSNGTTRTDEK